MAPNNRSARMRGEERLHRLQDRDRHQQRVDEPLGLGHEQEQGAPWTFDGASSASGLRLHPGDAVERRLGDGEERRARASSTMMATSMPASAVVNSAASTAVMAVPAGSRPAPGRSSGGPRAGRARAAASATVSSGSAWSWPSTWRTPCTTSRASSSSSVPAWSAAWRCGDRRAHDDVAEQQRQVAGSGGGRSGPLRPDVGDDITRRRRRRSGRRARRWARRAPRNCSFRTAMSSCFDEQQAQLDVAAHALGGEHGLGERPASGPGRRAPCAARRRRRPPARRRPPTFWRPPRCGRRRLTHGVARSAWRSPLLASARS